MNNRPEFTESPAAKAWHYFFKISEIPRPSSHEDKITAWLKALSEEKNWRFKTDEIGNVAIKVPGKGKLADSATLVLQGHLDMVCEKNSDSEHDFFNDPLKLKTDGEWVTAEGTTLGADNGVAIALALAVAQEDIKERRPIEMLFTMAEETGLKGANALDPQLIQGKTVVNIDSEEEGTFIIGCAGGEAVEVQFEPLAIPPIPALQCTLTGLRGGHSGMDVGCRSNAVISAGKIIRRLPGVKVHRFTAGDKPNAIPREAVFILSQTSPKEVIKAAEPILEAIRVNEPNAKIRFSETTTCRLLPDSLISFICGLKNGVISMHPDFEGVVQTSTSLTVARESEGKLTLLISTRSSSETEKFDVNDMVCELAGRSGAKVVRFDCYPGWSPSKSSDILNKSIKTYQNLFGKAPKVQSIHAGLECGIIGSRIQSSELVSMGPTIKNPHSPEERLNIASFDRVYELLKALVQL